MSGWIVPKTERPGPRNPISVGSACVPGDLMMNPKTTAAIPSGIVRTPNPPKISPTFTPRRLWPSSQWQRTSPDAPKR